MDLDLLDIVGWLFHWDQRRREKEDEKRRWDRSGIPRIVVVPDVRNIPIDQANKILTNAGLRISLGSTDDRVTTQSTVVDQDPKPGLSVRRGTLVAVQLQQLLKLATWPKVTMVDHVVVIGAGVYGAAVAASLARRGARVTVVDDGAPSRRMQS
jgi:NADPH-dependent 2,4-dienoyl-CoA reductase/sulfur reductase-like enzyme